MNILRQLLAVKPGLIHSRGRTAAFGGHANVVEQPLAVCFSLIGARDAPGRTVSRHSLCWPSTHHHPVARCEARLDRHVHTSVRLLCGGQENVITQLLAVNPDLICLRWS